MSLMLVSNPTQNINGVQTAIVGAIHRKWFWIVKENGSQNHRPIADINPLMTVATDPKNTSPLRLASSLFWHIVLQNRRHRYSDPKGIGL